MTASTTDAEYPAQVPLGEVLDITVTTDPAETTISVLYPNGTWDMVYQDGIFANAYLNSTLDGSVFHIRRAGNWPKGVKYRVKVKEEAGAEPVGHSFGAIYSVDFTAQSSLSLGTAGAYTIDGKTWYAKHTEAGAFGSNVVTEVVGGSGLTIRETTPGTATSEPATGGAVDYAARHLFMPLAQLAEYNPLAPLLVRFRVSGLDAGGSYMPAVGLCSSTDDGDALIAAHRQYDHYVVLYGNTRKRGISSPESPYLDAGTYLTTPQEYGVSSVAGLVYTEVAGPWAGSFGDINNLIASGVAPFKLAGARPNPGIFIGLQGQVDTSVTTYITHLQIMQPKVAP